MARIDTVSECDAAELARRLTARDDALVLERREEGPDGSGSLADTGASVFDGIDGPFHRYRRTVTWERVDRPDAPGAAGERYRVEQQLSYRWAIPYWGPLFSPMLRRVAARGIPAGTTPWWTTPNRLEPRQSTAAAAMAMFNLIAGIVYGLLTQILTFVSADLGDGTRTEQTSLLAAARIGVVVTMVAMVVADRRGRRTVAIWSFTVAAVLTVLTAAAPSMWAVGALQLVSRNLAIAGLLSVDTIAIEELPAGSRAMVTGLGTLTYGLGAGLVVMTLPLADLGPWGWRLSFLLAGLTLPLIWHAARLLPESRRFERHRAELDGTADPGTPAASRRIRGSRFVLLAAMFFLLNVLVAPASQLQNDYLRTEHHLSGTLITLFVLTTSTPAGIGVLLGGRLADTRSRRAAIIPGLIGVSAFTAVFYSVGGAPMWAASLLASTIGALAVPAMGVLAPELFPTAHRGGVRGALNAVAVGGSVCGLVFAGAVVDARGYSPAFLALAVAPLLGAGLAFAIPETRGRELEDLNR